MSLKELKQAFGKPYEVGLVIFPFMILTSIFAYEAIYMLLLELWCIAYGLFY